MMHSKFKNFDSKFMKFGKVWCLCELHRVVVSNNMNVDAHVSGSLL